MAAAETARLIAELTLKDKLSAGVKSAITSVDKLDSRMGRIGKTAGRGLANAAKNIERIGLVAGGAAAAGITYSVKAAGDFEAALNTINTVAQVTPDRLEAIGEGIRKISRETGTSVDDLGQAYYDLVSAGIKTADAQNVLTQANKLAIGGLATTSEAVDLLTTAINSYGGDASKAAEFTNQFAEAIGAGKVTASEIAASFATIGPIAANFGTGIDEISAALGVMTAKGTPAAEAFTQMRAAIKLLEKPTAGLSKLQKDLGVNFLKIAKKKGLVFAYNEIAKAAKKAGIPMTALTGRIEAAQFAAQVTGENFAGYNAELEKVRHSSDGVGVAQEQMAQRTKGFNFAMERLKANVHDAAITIGSELLPQFADLANEATTWIQAHQPEIKAFAKDLAGGLRDAARWAASLDWGAITSTLRVGAAFGKTLVEAFVNAPPWVQSFLAGGFVANKFTGGALGGIIKELGAGLIKGVLGINAGVVNVNGGVVNGGGLPGVGGKVGGGGLLSLLGGAAGIATIAAVAVPIAAGIAIGEVINDATLKDPALTRQREIHAARSTQVGGRGGNPNAIRDDRAVVAAIKSQTATLAGKIADDKAAVVAALHAKGIAVPAEQRPRATGKEIDDRSWAVLAKSSDIDKVASITGKMKDDTVSWLGKNHEAGVAIAERVSTASGQQVAAVGTAKSGIQSSVSSGSAMVASAVRANRPIITTNVKVNVTAATVSKSVVVQSRYGPGNGSAGRNGGGPGSNGGGL